MTGPRRAKGSERSGPRAERPSPVAENYLLSLYGLWEEDVRVTLGQLAESLKRMPESEGLGTSLPSVAGMVRRMEQEGLLETGASKDIQLTAEGFKRAEDITRRHRLAERMVVDLLGVGLPRAHLEAHRLEHAISQELLLNITERLNQPTTSPFGHPIPGSGHQPSTLPSVSLDEAESGETYVVERVPEDNESLVQFLVDKSIVPGSTITIGEAAAYRGVITLQIGDREASLGYEAAAQIRVLKS